MHDWPTLLLSSLLIGIGATAVMDVYAWAMKRLFAIPSLDYALVGRWIGHLPQGRLIHAGIAASAPVAGERAIGWGAHYAIGVAFAGALLAVCGVEWARAPTFGPALATGLVTVAAPFLILQPGMGAGIAAAKTPRPSVARLRSLLAHGAFGAGLYLSAALLAALGAF